MSPTGHYLSAIACGMKCRIMRATAQAGAGSPPRHQTTAKFRHLMLAVHEQCEKENDRKRNSDQPEQRAFAETHVSLHTVVTAGITRHDFESSPIAARSMGWCAVPIQREVAYQRRTGARDQIADQLRGEKAEGDAVAAIAIGGVDAFGARHRTDQRQAIAGGVERAGPAELDVETGGRPQRGELPRQQPRLLGIRASRASDSITSSLSSPPMMMRPAAVVRA